MCPVKTTFNFEFFSKEYALWSHKNFGAILTAQDGYKYAHQPLLGIIEELGELAEAVKIYNEHKQELMFTTSIDRSITDAVVDAVGDVMIFMSDYCRCMHIDITYIAESVLINTPNKNIFTICSKLCREQLKYEQDIRGTKEEHLKRIKQYLKEIYSILVLTCIDCGLDFDYCMEKTWREVKKRDWTKNKENGEVEIKILKTEVKE